MSNSGSTSRRSVVALPFHSIRSVSSPEDTENGRKVYMGHVPITAIVSLSTEANVRDYLLEAEGRKARKPTQVHRAILETLESTPANFSVLNGGLVLVAHSCEIDEKGKVLNLGEPSIINGSQTQGIVKDFLRHRKEKGIELPDPIPHVKFELIVTDDEDLIADISIARNFQNDVMTISIAGRLKQLDELELALQRKIPGAKLKKSETKLSDDYVQTEKLLQVIAALVPDELVVEKDGTKRGRSKAYCYSMKARCLKDFREMYEAAHNPKAERHAEYSALYGFYLDICAEALAIYDRWKEHQGFRGTGLHAIERDGERIVSVPDGIVFPIIAAHSVFAKKTPSGWRIAPPVSFDDGELIRVAKSVYQEIAHSKPMEMGKSTPCYSALLQITSLYQRLSGHLV